MKKIITIILILTLSLTFTACSTTEKNLEKELGIEIEINKKDARFSEEEIATGIKTIKDNFDFTGCTLIKVEYNEEKTSEVLYDYYNGFINSMEKVPLQNLAVFTTDFIVDKNGTSEVFERGTVQKDYNWIMIYKGNNEWEVSLSGY